MDMIEKDLKNMSMNFLIACYFGQSKNLVKAAIDRGYADMASHTLTGFENTKDGIKRKWSCRLNASTLIANALYDYPNSSSCFQEWHGKVIQGIQDIYLEEIEKFSYGQAQKWLNMSIKYLFVFKTLLSVDDERLTFFHKFLKNTDAKDYYPPIDSYVLKGAGLQGTWSDFEEKEYSDICDQMGTERNFIWELGNWEAFSEKYSQNDSKSYAKYYEKNKDQDRNIYLGTAGKEKDSEI